MPGNVGRVVSDHDREGATSWPTRTRFRRPTPSNRPFHPIDADPELIDVEDEPEIGVEVPEADAMEQSRARAVPAAVAAKPMPLEAPEHDVLDQRLEAGGDDDEDDFR